MIEYLLAGAIGGITIWLLQVLWAFPSFIKEKSESAEPFKFMFSNTEYFVLTHEQLDTLESEAVNDYISGNVDENNS